MNSKLSYDIENCIQQTHLRVAERSAELGLLSERCSIGSGTACFLGKDSFLSQVIGWGFNADMPTIAEELEQIERFYETCQFSSIHIELSPLCGNNVAELLSKTGYQISEFSNIAILNLDDYCHSSLPDIANVICTIPDDIVPWSEKIALGFGCPEAASQFYVYASSKNILPFQMNINNEMAAGGTLALHNTWCDLGVTSTMPSYRGQGLQKALLHARLAYAKKSGAKMAVVTTSPGSISDCNVQKVGFRTAYTRVKLSKV